jgi:hypothetical protein
MTHDIHVNIILFCFIIDLPYEFITEWAICKLAEELGNELMTFDLMNFGLFYGTSPTSYTPGSLFWLGFYEWHLFWK